MLVHPIEPVFDENSEILILGSFPSVKSREEGFFYGHKQNRFWRVMAEVFACPIPATVEEKRALLLENRVALWDVIKSCEIEGSADSSIKDVTPNDLSRVFCAAQIRKIFLNGKTAEKCFYKYVPRPELLPPVVTLPSTSPANAAWTLEKLTEKWKEILK